MTQPFEYLETMPDFADPFTILIGGSAVAGKSVSLRNIPSPEGVLLFNTEDKDFPLVSEPYNIFRVYDPEVLTNLLEAFMSVDTGNLTEEEIYTAFKDADIMPTKELEKIKNIDFKSIHTIVIDSISFLMSKYEDVYITPADNKMAAWGDYGTYFRNLMTLLSESGRNLIVTGHTTTELNKKDRSMETFITVKGATKNIGVEAYFGTIVGAVRLDLAELDPYLTDDNKLLAITQYEKKTDSKCVFQTQSSDLDGTRRLRPTPGLFTIAETYMNNDVGLIIKRLTEFSEAQEDIFNTY